MTRMASFAKMLRLFPGTYRDRRNQMLLDCSQTIWLVATNQAQSTILQFYKKSLKGVPKFRQTAAPWKVLDSQIRKDFAGRFGVSVLSFIYHYAC